MEKWVVGNLIGTGVLLIVILTIRTLTARYIRTSNKSWTSQQRLRGLGYIRSASIILFLLGLIYLWGEAIQGLAVSVFAIAFALIFSIKETCMSLNGAFLRLQGHTYEIGDRIIVKGIQGDVIDVSMLSTTVMEIGEGGSRHQLTGRKIVFPNSLLLTEHVTNESFLGNYQLLDLKFPLVMNEEWTRARDILMQVAKEECAPYLDHARNRVRLLEKTRSIELPSVEPKVRIHIPSPERIDVHLRVPCPSHLKERLSQVITTRFLEHFLKKD
ncbi:MAG: mechanosensitive ion channel family protein [Rhabdochlamydiaceae bacterium]|nr:mechanosensitive ion channel family protein [Candidatus Amphrikana amoebophyrae]